MMRSDTETGVEDDKQLLVEDKGVSSSSSLKIAHGWRAFYTVGHEAHPGMILFIMSVFVFLQSSLAQGILPSVLTTIQKEYNLSGEQSGWILSSYDAAVCAALLPLGHYGVRSHIPRIISAGVLIIGFGSILSGLIPFIYPDGGTAAFPLLLISNIIMGLGNSPMYILVFPYFAMIVSKRKLPYYSAVWVATSSFGPAVGLFVGGFCSSSDLWFIPFLVGGGLYIFFAMFGWWFPRFRDRSHIGDDSNDPTHLPSCNCCGGRRGAASQPTTTTKDQTLTEEEQIIPYFGDSENHDLSFAATLRIFAQVVRDPTFLLITINAVAAAFVLGSIVPFAPQFGQVSFNLDPDISSISFGVTAIPGAVLGTLFGGWLSKRLNASNLGILIIILVSFILTIPLAPIFLIPWPQLFFPLLILIEITSFTSAGLVPSVITRIVEPKHRGMAVACQTLLSRLLGSVPAPIIIGKLIDSTCIELDPKGDNCLTYDVAAFRQVFFGDAMIGAAVALISISFAIYTWRRKLKSSADTIKIASRLRSSSEDYGSQLH